MEDKRVENDHVLSLSCRQKGSVTGVTDVVSFDEKVILLETVCGRLTVKGEDLHVRELNLEKGDVTLEGSVDSVLYNQKQKADSREKDSILGRLFK